MGLRHAWLAVAIVGALGLAASPSSPFSMQSGGSEAVSALSTGAVLLLLAAAARRVPVRKE